MAKNQRPDGNHGAHAPRSVKDREPYGTKNCPKKKKITASKKTQRRADRVIY